MPKCREGQGWPRAAGIPAMAIKKPRIRFRVRGFGFFVCVAGRALPHTSVGNKKYEDEDRKLTRADEP